MSVLATLEADFSAVEADVKAWFVAIDTDAKALVAHIWNDVKTELASVWATLGAQAQAALPAFIAQLKAYAVSAAKMAVTAFAADLPQWLAGTVKFNYVCQALWNVVKTGGITFLGQALALSQVSVQTLVQTVAASVLAAVI